MKDDMNNELKAMQNKHDELMNSKALIFNELKGENENNDIIREAQLAEQARKIKILEHDLDNDRKSFQTYRQEAESSKLLLSNQNIEKECHIKELETNLLSLERS